MYLILDVDYNAEAMSDEPCENCGHDSIGSAGGCLDYPCDCGIGREHKVTKSEEPIASIVSLKWLGAEVLEPYVTLTEDGDGDLMDEFGGWHRKWSGDVPENAVIELRRTWDLDNDNSEPNMGMLNEYGLMPGWRWHFGGEDWNSGGWTPILDVSLSLEPTEAEFEANPEHFGYTTTV